VRVDGEGGVAVIERDNQPGLIDGTSKFITWLESDLAPMVGVMDGAFMHGVPRVGLIRSSNIVCSMAAPPVARVDLDVADFQLRIVIRSS
jgi:hypothetical protein